MATTQKKVDKATKEMLDEVRGEIQKEIDRLGTESSGKFAQVEAQLKQFAVDNKAIGDENRRLAAELDHLQIRDHENKALADECRRLGAELTQVRDAMKQAITVGTAASTVSNSKEVDVEKLVSVFKANFPLTDSDMKKLKEVFVKAVASMRKRLVAEFQR